MRTVHFAAALALMLGAACSHSTPAPQTASESHATSSAQEQQLASVTIDELAGLLDRHEQVAVFDNNSPERYAQGHVPTARHVGHDEVTASVLPADHAARLVFYCANEHCTACHTAARQAIALGYTNVYILPAGIMGWTSAGKPVVTGTNPS